MDSKGAHFHVNTIKYDKNVLWHLTCVERFVYGSLATLINWSWADIFTSSQNRGLLFGTLFDIFFFFEGIRLNIPSHKSFKWPKIIKEYQLMWSLLDAASEGVCEFELKNWLQSSENLWNIWSLTALLHGSLF